MTLVTPLVERCCFGSSPYGNCGPASKPISRPEKRGLEGMPLIVPLVERKSSMASCLFPSPRFSSVSRLRVVVNCPVLPILLLLRRRRSTLRSIRRRTLPPRPGDPPPFRPPPPHGLILRNRAHDALQFRFSCGEEIRQEAPFFSICIFHFVLTI